MKVLWRQWHQNLRIWNVRCQLFSDLFWCLNICLCWQIIAPLCWLIRSCKIILISSSQQSPPAMSAPVFLQSWVNRILMNDSSLPSSCWQQVSTFKGRRLLTFTIFWNWKLSEQGHCMSMMWTLLLWLTQSTNFLNCLSQISALKALFCLLISKSCISQPD